MKNNLINVDLYTKAILTIIAVSLMSLAFQKNSFSRLAYAEDEIKLVKIVGIEKTLLPIQTQITNDSLHVKFEKYPLDVIVNDPNYYSKK